MVTANTAWTRVGHHQRDATRRRRTPETGLLAEVLIGAREPREPVDDGNFASVGGGREVDGERHLALACRRDVRPAAQRAAEELHGGLERRHAAMK